MKWQRFFTLALSIFISSQLGYFSMRAETYDMHKVKGIEAFSGSKSAKELLAKNGFVVADPAFKQIFEPYIKSPQTEKSSREKPKGESLPSFITADSAWHTYHVLLEEGVKEMEEIQSERLLAFSQRLLVAIKEKTQSTETDDLVLFASVGLALQDEKHRQSLSSNEKRIVGGLRDGSASVNVPIGFELSPTSFRAQSFYTQSPELSDYFAARQWYASVVFRLANPRETKLAITVALLINNEPELMRLWQQLSDPFDAFLATAEDGTVRQYAEVAKRLLGTEPQNPLDNDKMAEIQSSLGSLLPSPRVNDQLLSPEQYLRFARETRGFRLLPPRRLPDAICFHETVDPKIPKRMYPSGLDFLAVSPVLRSASAVRAVESQFGKSASELILKADCGPMPDSLHGEAMQLLATLQKPLPNTAPAPTRTEAWSDLQLWSQLGAWAEQRHTWALHTKLTVSYMGIITPPKGIVAPYPEFFSGLAKLTSRTADAFQKSGLEQNFDVKTVANDLSNALKLSHTGWRADREKEYEKVSGKIEQLSQFQNHYYEKHRAEIANDRSGNAYKKRKKDLEELATRCAASGQATDSEAETLRSYFECRQNIARLLKEFVPVCDRLTQLANKSLKNEGLTEADATWIENYGVTLAGFHFYYGNSYEVPLDNFPMVTRVFSNPLTDSMLYAGLARPQALYIIVPDGKSNQLYRGAVLTYREFVRPNSQLLDDQSWREMVFTGQTPPAPPFTKSFCAETSVSELLKKLRRPGRSQDDEDIDYHDVDAILWQIGSRVTEKDLPELFEMLIHTKGEDGRWDVVDGLAEIIGRLPWKSREKQLTELLGSSDNILAKAVARIFIEHPESVDSTLLTSNFTNQPIRKRRLVCAIISRLPQQTDMTRRTLLLALHDQTDGIRWQAALAIGKTGCNDAQSISALEKALGDTNQFVGGVAAHSLARLGATNSAPILLTKLETSLATDTPITILEQQSREITRDMRGEENHALNVLDPDRLETRMYVSAEVNANMKRMAAARLPPRPFNLPMDNRDLPAWLIEALGELKYAPATDKFFKLRGTDYETVALGVLRKVAPERLFDDLLTTAKDKQTDSYLREKALVKLGNLSATNHVRDLAPLLDDATPIVYSRPLPGDEWRICDRAAVTISVLLGWEHGVTPAFYRTEQREEMMKRAREWAKASP